MATVFIPTRSPGVLHPMMPPIANISSAHFIFMYQVGLRWVATEISDWQRSQDSAASRQARASRR